MKSEITRGKNVLSELKKQKQISEKEYDSARINALHAVLRNDYLKDDYGHAALVLDSLIHLDPNKDLNLKFLSDGVHDCLNKNNLSAAVGLYVQAIYGSEIYRHLIISMQIF